MPAVLDRLHAERSRLLEMVDEITTVADESDRDLTESEQQLIARHRLRIDDEIDPQIERLEEIETSRARHVRRVAELAPAPAQLARTATQSDEPVYRTFAEYAQDTLICRYDQIASRAGPGARQRAEERLQRAVAATISSDVAGLIKPQYLADLAQKIDGSRPIVDTARKVSLTSGTLQYPSITQKPTAVKQATEKTEPTNQKMTVAFVSVTADTYMSVGDLSWQSIQWSEPGVLGLWFDLATEQYSLQTEAATGTVLGAATLSTPSVTIATATLAEWMAAITAAAAAIYTASNRRPTHVYADVATGYKLMGLVGTVSPHFIATGDFSLRSGTGNIAGLTLVISKGLAASTVVVGDSQSLLAAETAGAPVELQAVQPSIGGLEVGVIGAFVSKITDAGGFRKLTLV